MQINIKNLIDDIQCYETVRKLRWPDGTECPFCNSKHVINEALMIKSRRVNVMNAKTAIRGLTI